MNRVELFNMLPLLRIKNDDLKLFGLAFSVFNENWRQIVDISALVSVIVDSSHHVFRSQSQQLIYSVMKRNKNINDSDKVLFMANFSQI